MSLQQIRSSAQLLGVAQANKYSNVDEMMPGVNAFLTEVCGAVEDGAFERSDEMVPGIGAFLAEVRVLLCDLQGGCRMPLAYHIHTTYIPPTYHLHTTYIPHTYHIHTT
jgi:hypothetical protein